MSGFRLILWRHLIGEPLRTAITIAGVGLGVAVYVAIAAANVEVLRSFEQTVLGVAGRTTLQISSSATGTGGFEETVMARLRHLDGVVQATPVLELTAIWRPGGGRANGSDAPVVWPILGVDLLAESSFRDYQVVGGAQEESAWERYLEPDTLFLGRRLATRYGLVPGTVVEVRVGALLRRLVIRGLVEGQGPAQATLEELAVMDIAAAQWTFERVGRLDRIDVVSDPARAVEEVRLAVQAALSPALTVTRPEQRNAQVERMTRAFRLNVASLSAVALLVGLFLVYNTMSFAVVRRRREIGILRALGVAPSGIAGLFFAEAVVVGVAGTVVGLGFGAVLAQGALQVIATTLGNLYEVRGLSEMNPLSLGVLGQSLLVGIGVAVLGALGPVREAGRVAPAQALAPTGYGTVGTSRRSPALKRALVLLTAAGLAALPGPVQGLPLFGYLSAFLLMVGFAWLSPVVMMGVGSLLRAILPRDGYLARIAVGELDRAPARHTVAVAALMVGLALMIGMGILIQSFRQTVDLWLDQTVKADVIVVSPTWLGTGPHSLLAESVVRRLQDLPGVQAIDGYRDLRMEFRGMPVTVVARDMLVHAQHSRYLFLEGGSSTAVLTEAVRRRQVLVSEAFATQFRLRAGDQVTLMSPAGPQPFTIGGVFYDYSTDGGKVVMDRSLYARVWGDRSSTVVPIYLAAGTDLEGVRQAIAARLQGDPPVMVLTNRELKQEALRLFDQTFAITYALEVIAVIVALLGIVNTLLAGILERQGELAVVRAIGGTPAQIGRLILWESGLLGLAGAVLGVGAGLALSVLLVEVINKQSFGWTILFHPSPLVLVQAVGLALVTTLLAGYGPARRAARLPVAESLRCE